MTAAPAAGAAARHGPVDGLIAASLVVVAVAATAEVYTGERSFALLAGGALVLFCLLGQRHFGLRERVLLAVALLLTGAEVALEPDALETVRRALEQAAFLAAFMLLIGVMRDAASTSPAVEATGRFLTEQPPNRRYAAIAGGSHGLTVLLNLGALSLLAPLIQRGVAAGRAAGDGDLVSAVKERRQFSASLRGLQTVIVWAPTTVTQALLASLFPGADGGLVILCGLALAALVLLAGWIEDTLRWRPLARRLAREGRPRARGTRPPTRAIARFLTVCAALVALAASFRIVFGVATVPALMLAAPILNLLWIFCQYRGEGIAAAAGRTLERGRRIVSRQVPASSPEAVTLAAAGYIGTVAAALVPAEWIAVAVSPETVPQFLLLALLPLAMVLATQAALTPIVLAVFIGTALGKVGGPGLDPTLLVMALSGGWAIALTASPFTGAALVLNRIAGIPATRLTWEWNLGFSAIFYLILVAWLWLLFVTGAT